MTKFNTNFKEYDKCLNQSIHNTEWAHREGNNYTGGWVGAGGGGGADLQKIIK